MQRRLALALLVGSPLAVRAQSGGSSPAARTLKWDELIPPNWDPMKDLQGANLDVLQDSDPRAAAMMKRMREVWDNAPVNQSVAGQRVRLPGYVVPLEEVKDGLKEFLLVPYFGACIHTPPPPANQIVHVVAAQPLKGLRSMDAVWVTGQLSIARGDTVMGVSGYRLEASLVLPYGGAR